MQLARESKIDINLCGSKLEVDIKKSNRLKRNINFEIKESNNNPYLEIKTPYSLSKSYLQQILAKNRSSLEILFKKYLNSKERYLNLEKENQILLFGKPVDLEIVKSKENSFEYKENKIYIKIDFPYSKEIKEQVRQKLYKEQANTHITPIFFKWQEIMQLNATNLRYRKNRSIWGSCSTKDSISLNSYLCLLPFEVIEYVIIHELSHIKHKNHSKKFWSLVSKYSPNYKELKAELKSYTRFLKI